MHIYIYDNYINQKKYDRVLAKIETRITDLGLNGKIVRIGMMNSAEEAVKNEMRKGAKTIIAVGNNRIFNVALDSIANFGFRNSLGKKVPLGLIPIDKKDNEIADLLGIPKEEDACDVLSARRISELDLGVAGNRHFLTQAIIRAEGTTVEIDQNYSIENAQSGVIGVANLPFENILPPGAKSSGLDGAMELCIISKIKSLIPSQGKTSQSVFSFKSLNIFNKDEAVTIDGAISIKTPVTIKISQEKLGIIVGKNRTFE
jgi:diacylglycerol kinase family enzyme